MKLIALLCRISASAIPLPHPVPLRTRELHVRLAAGYDSTLRTPKAAGNRKVRSTVDAVGTHYVDGKRI